MTASERRAAILEVLCLRRHETRENLAFEFGVSKRTIEYDILALSLEYPIYTVQGKGGGIYVDENYRLGKSYLKDEEQKMLERLLPNLNEQDAKLMQNILSKFGLKGEKK